MQEAARREKRRLLDAQRGKCRVRLGSHLDEWCALKDHLGFSLHSQLAKLLLDSYRTTANTGTPVPKAIALLSVSVSSLHRLAFLCHQHGRNCNSPPTLLAQPCSMEALEKPVLLWGCKEDHQFYWEAQDCSAGLDGEKTEEDLTVLSSMQQNRTVGQENVPEITPEEGPAFNAEDKINVQKSDNELHGTAIQERLYETQSRSDASHYTGPDHVNVEPQQWNNAERITESSSEETLNMTTGNEWLLNTNVSEKQQEEVVVIEEGLCQSVGHKIIVSSAEIGDTDVEDTGPQSVETSEDMQENISMALAQKKTKIPSSGRVYRRQKTHNQLSQSYQKAIKSELKAALSFPCRRSPRSSKGCRVKSDAEVSQLTGVPRVSNDTQGQDVDLPGSVPDIDISRRISHLQESLIEDDSRQKAPSENLEGIDAVKQPKEPPPVEPQSERAQMSGAVREEQQKTKMEEHVTEQEPHSSQCRGQKTGRHKSLLDEELAQICKKRIRKAAPQELLMCEYDDCGKIFSKRQYLNYHQKYQHMNQRTFRCSVTECGKTFNFKKHLKEHEKRHSDRRDFICEFCARAFRSSSNLIIHRRIHTGEKPLQCEFCGFTCRQKASLNWHMKKHDADSFYKFPCDICGQRFEKRDNLAAHKSRKHPAPRETGPQDTSQCITSSVHEACQAEANCKDDHIERLSRDPNQEMALMTTEGVKETLFPEHLDVTDNVPEISQQTTQTPGNTGISLVIVL